VLAPQGHWNYYATNAIISGSIYTDLFIPSLAVYNWAGNKYDYWLAESSKQNGDNYDVKLRSGLKWDDGKPFTAKDVVTTYMVGRWLRMASGTSIDKVEAVDDLTRPLPLHEADEPWRAAHPAERHSSRTPSMGHSQRRHRTSTRVAARNSTGRRQGPHQGDETTSVRPTRRRSGPYKIDRRA
jgi:ABC-type transport system substrate-binding protein